MTDDREKTFKKDVIESLNKAEGLLQQSLPKIAQLIKNFDAVERAKAISDPKNFETIGQGLMKLADAILIPREVIKHAASDFQLKDLFSRIEAFIAKANPAFMDLFSKKAIPAEAPTKEPSKKSRVKKPRSKKKGEKMASKKVPPKRKTKRSPKRKLLR
jgi:hypothetical protein